MNFGARRKKAWVAAQAAGVDALLVTHLPDVIYLTGFTGSNGAVVLVGSAGGAVRAVLFTDGRYTGQARVEARGVKVVIEKKSAVGGACAWMEAAGVRRCGFDETQTTGVGAVVARLREVKDADEIAAIRAAALVGCELYEGMLGFIQAGMAEFEIAAALEYAARLRGVEAMSFETIVASGERSALPHGRATGAKLPRRGFVTLDFGVVLGGYCSDMTRTVHLGRALPGEWEVYDSVLEAQTAAVARVAPGVTAGEVDEAARSVLRRSGLDRYFSHSTGHGVGLEIHEGPRIAAEQAQVLEEGMVITIEPGVYMPGRFGVRIEDMILVTKRGGEVLTPSVKAWTEL